MKLADLANYIQKAALRADINISDSLGRHANIFENDLKMHAPVDKGDFKDSWSSSPITNKSGDKSVTISNDEVYSSAIEFGSVPGESPWPTPGPKTVMSGGRIFSTQAVGGTIDKTFSKENVRGFAIEIANSILRAFR
jgi:hypothetical protein